MATTLCPASAGQSPLAVQGCRCYPGTTPWCGEFEVPIIVAASSFRNLKFKSRTRFIELLVVLRFRSSYRNMPRALTNFGIGPLVNSVQLNVVDCRGRVAAAFNMPTITTRACCKFVARSDVQI